MGLLSLSPPPIGQDFTSPQWVRWFNDLHAGLVLLKPLAVPSYTLAGMPAASASTGKYIHVSNATGGAKLCYSNGTNWVLANTATIVS